MTINGDLYPFSTKNVNAAPEKHGVYALYEDGVLIYIGRAAGENVTIRSRLKSHHGGDEGPCTQAATHYRREGNSRSVAKERELIDEYFNRFGRLPRCNDVRP